MNFWDSSAIIPLLVPEAQSRPVRLFLDASPGVALWWGTPVECVSALARQEREGALELADMNKALKNLKLIAANSICIDTTERVKNFAQKLLRRHSLRAADSLQLAAACVFAGDGSHVIQFVGYDQRLRLAASKEGFETLAPGES